MASKNRIALLFMLATFVCGYLGLWYYSARWLQQEIDTLYAKQSTQTKTDFIFLGEKPKLTNFPFVPEIKYTTGFQSGDVKILFPDMVVRGYPLPFTTLSLQFPHGIAMESLMLAKNVWVIDSLMAKLVIPAHLPVGLYAEDLRAWQLQNGKIEILSYEITKGTMTANGKGLVSIDAALQPVVSLDSKLTGYDSYILSLKDSGTIEPLAAAFAMTMLNGLSSIDPITKEKNASVAVMIQNQMLSVGPIQALPLPPIVWDTRTAPVLHQ